MKHLTYLLAICFFAISCSSIKQKQTSTHGLTGKLTNFSNIRKMYLMKHRKPDMYTVSGNYLIDSASISLNGEFSFPDFNRLDTTFVYKLLSVPKGMSPAYINRGLGENNYIFLVNSGKPIHLVADAKRLTLSYSLQGDVGSANGKITAIKDLELPLYKISEQMKPLLDEAKGNEQKTQEIMSSFIKELKDAHQNSFSPKIKMMLEQEKDPRIAGILLSDLQLGPKWEELEPEINLMLKTIPDHLKNHPYCQYFENVFKVEKLVLPKNTLAPDIQLTTPDGKQINLYDTKAKLILIDFWASWCSPCRQQNKETLKPLYAAYKDKGLEVFSVSLDENKKSWLKAIKDDQYAWLHCVDLKGFKSTTAKNYSITGVPMTLFVNEKFQIIAKDLHSTEMDSFVKEYLNKH